MRKLPAILIILASAAGYAQQRPQVPCEPAAVRLPSRTVAMVGGTAKVTSPADLSPLNVSEAGLVHLILASEDDLALRALLVQMGLTIREGTQSRQLPEFMLAVGCVPIGRDGPSEAGALAELEPPASIRVARYLAGSDAVVDYVAAHQQDRFIVILDIHNLSAAALKSLGGDNIVAIVVGHYLGADGLPHELAGYGEQTRQVVRAIRLVSDAPVLLAVSASLAYAKRIDRGWVVAFDAAVMESFDGWAIYNLHNWPAILEATDNPRTAVLNNLGLPGKPCLLLDFVGTPSSYVRGDQPQRAEYVKASWMAKAPRLLAKLKEQGWRGATFYTTNLADAQMKAAVLNQALQGN